MLTVLYGKPYNFQNILFPLDQNKKKMRIKVGPKIFCLGKTANE